MPGFSLWPTNRLLPYAADKSACRASILELRDLLQRQRDLNERDDILPFFQRNPHLAPVFAAFNPNVGFPDILAYELSLLGKYTADLVVGNSSTGNFVFVEFENAIQSKHVFRSSARFIQQRFPVVAPKSPCEACQTYDHVLSIFRNRGRSTPYWSDRFEQGYSQIIDWFHLLDSQRKTDEFMELFGRGSIKMMGLLVIGRQEYLDESGFRRLDWRRDKVVVDSKTVVCVTYDELLQLLMRHVTLASIMQQAQAIAIS